jgi:large subunit ribosomal protein L29
MKAKELRERPEVELKQMASDLRRDLFKTRFQNFTNQLDNTAKLRRLRRQIARIETLLTEKAR